MANAPLNKFRHVFGDPFKQSGTFRGIKPMTSGESTYADANENFVAVCKQGGGGPIYVLNQNSPMKVPGNAPTINVHKGKCLDISFHPFHPTLIATAGEDTKTCVTSFPADGLTENVRISQAFPLFFLSGNVQHFPRIQAWICCRSPLSLVFLHVVLRLVYTRFVLPSLPHR